MNKNIRWRCKDFIVKDDELELYDDRNSVYIKLKSENDTLKLIDFFQMKYDENIRLELIAHYKDKVIFAPGMGNVIRIYDKKDKTTENIILDAELIGGFNKSEMFCKIIAWKNCAYLFPRSATAIVKINMISYEVEYYTQWYNESNVESSGWIFSGFGYQIGARCYLPFTYQNKILCFDLDAEKHCIYDVENVNGGFAAMTYDGKDIWLAGLFENKIYRLDVQTGETESYEISNIDVKQKGFLELFCEKDILVLVPLRGCNVYLWSIETKEIIKQIMLPVKTERYKKNRYFYSTDMISEMKMLGCSLETGTLLKIDLNNGQVLEFDTKYSEEVTCEILRNIFYTQSIDTIYKENDCIDLEFLLKIINNDNVLEREIKTEIGDKYLLI